MILGRSGWGLAWRSLHAHARAGTCNDCCAIGQPAYSPVQAAQLISRIAAASPGASSESLGAEAGKAMGVPVVR